VGWLEWKYGGGNKRHLGISSLQIWHHALIILAILILAFANGWLMQNYTDAAWPFMDSFTTWASVITTFMVVFKVLENWLYWLMIDAISIVLYVDRGLFMTALLFATYLIIVIFAYLKWRRIYLEVGRRQLA
jgi:nicotinamide mononucleotide transporter